MLENNPQIQHLIGHSLAGSVNAQLRKDNPDRDLTLTTYGAPFCQTKMVTTTQAHEILEI